MRVMVLVKATADSEQGFNPTPESLAMMEAMGRFNAELEAANVIVSGDGLKPTSEGIRVHFNGRERTTTPGPFSNPGNQVAGFWIWNVRDMEEAIAWAKRCPNPMPGPSDLELRPIYEAEDLS
jgi:hypothetical protein